MFRTLHSTDLLGSIELQITCDSLQQHSLTQHVTIEHSNKQLLSTSVCTFCGSHSTHKCPVCHKHSICKGLVKRQMSWIQNFTDDMQKLEKTRCRKSSPSASASRTRKNPPQE